MTDDRLKELRVLPVWSEAVEPILQAELQRVYKLLALSADTRTLLMLQGAVAEINILLGDPEIERMRIAVAAENARHLHPTGEDDQEEEDDNARRRLDSEFGRGRNDYGLADPRGWSSR